MAIFDEKIEIRERCKGVHCVDLGESFPRSIYLQNLASIQPRTSLVKFASSPRTDHPGLVISACGAAAINQAVKSIAIARGAYLEHDDLEIDVFGVELANDREFKHLVYIDLQFVRTRERPTSSFRRWTTHKVNWPLISNARTGEKAKEISKSQIPISRTF